MSKKKKDWKTEKERLLQLTQEERRKEFRYKEFIPLEKIPTWGDEKRPVKEEEEDEEENVLTGGGGGGLSDKVSLYKGDITVLEVDAIVNAANTSLLGGGGVDGCIHKAAGSCLYDECHSLNGCETGKAKITCGYDLPARYVIHTVGPVARGHVGPTERSDLTSCYQNSLNLVKEHDLKSVKSGVGSNDSFLSLDVALIYSSNGMELRRIDYVVLDDLRRFMAEAFPCISTGIYGYPNDPAADIALNTVKKWLEENPDKVTRVIFCVFLETDFSIYKKKMSDIFQDSDMEVQEEPPMGDTTPPSTNSTTKDESEDNKKGEEETGDEKEGDNDAGINEDVEMESQKTEPCVEKSQEQRDDEQDKDKGEEKRAENEGDKDDISNGNQHEDKAEQDKPADKLEDSDAAKPDVEMKDLSDNNAGTSNREEQKNPESSEETDPSKTESIQPKDPAEDKE